MSAVLTLVSLNEQAQVWCSQVNVNHGFEYGDMVGDGVYRCMGVNAWYTPFAFSAHSC